MLGWQDVGGGRKRRTLSADRRSGVVAGRVDKARSSRFRGVTKHRRSGRSVQYLAVAN